MNRTKISTSGGDGNWEWLEFDLEEFVFKVHRSGFRRTGFLCSRLSSEDIHALTEFKKVPRIAVLKLPDFFNTGTWKLSEFVIMRFETLIGHIKLATFFIRGNCFAGFGGVGGGTFTGAGIGGGPIFGVVICCRRSKTSDARAGGRNSCIYRRRRKRLCFRPSCPFSSFSFAGCRSRFAKS
jgi:hypothetical protein